MTSETVQFQWQRLRRMQRFATGLLVVMVGIFVVARSFEEDGGAWIGYVRSFAEAAMVGALADWFAIVALFRHPLGLPIPHTAVVPRNKNRIGGSLGRFVATHFLTPEVLSPRLEDLDLVGAAATWLRANAPRVVDSLGEQIPRLLELVDDEAVAAFLQEQLETQVDKIDPAPLAGRVLEMLTEGDRHKELLCDALKLLDGWMAREREWLWQQVRREIRLPEWPGVAGLKDRIADYVAEKLVEKITDLVHDVGNEPEHPFHAKFRQTLETQIENLRSSPAYRARAEAIKQQLMEHPAVADYVGQVWRSVQDWAKQDLAGDESRIRDHLRTLVDGIAGTLDEEAGLRDRLNRSLRETIVGFVVRYRSEAEKIIHDTVATWETEDVCANLEREVGRDLQFIRINGTLVGGTVGVLIHLVSETLWRG